MKICVIGAGAMGATYGGRLANSGNEVAFVDAWSDHVDAINENGLKLTGIPGDLTIPAQAYLPNDVPSLGCDLAIVTVDSNNTAAAARIAKHLLKPGGAALTIQNGIGNVEELTGALGENSVMVCSTMCSAIPIAAGHIDQTHENKTTIGEIDGAQSSRAREMQAKLTSAGFETVISGDIMAVIWNKFVLNVSINALCAVTGLRLGELARNADMDEYQDRIIEEALAVVAAKGVTLPDPDIRRTIKRHCWSKFSKPSMLQHMEGGRKTEIDALNGAVVREGKALGIATPYNEALTAMVKGRESAVHRALFEPETDYEKLEKNAGEWPSSQTAD